MASVSRRVYKKVAIIDKPTTCALFDFKRQKKQVIKLKKTHSFRLHNLSNTDGYKIPKLENMYLHAKVILFKKPLKCH